MGEMIIFYHCFLFCLFHFSKGHSEIIGSDLHLHKTQKLEIHNKYDYVNVSCEIHDDCHEFIHNSECLNEKCQCPESLILNGDGTKCLEKVKGFGFPCEEDRQCSDTLFSGGACINDSCRCKKGYHYLKGACWKNQKLGGRCRQSEQCFSSYDYRGQVCREKICECRIGYYNRLNAGCRKLRKIGESCSVDSDCPENSTCDKMKCSGAFEQPMPLVPVEMKRKENIVPLMPDFNGTCPRGMFVRDDKCVLELGMNCTKNDECSHISKALCLDNVCSCDPVFAIANDNNTKCLQVARGKVSNVSKSACNENPQCAIFGDHSYCLNRKCACENGTYWESEHQICWKIKTPGENCESDKDCYQDEIHANCQNSKQNNTEKLCTCQEGYFQRGSRCLPQARKVGEYCEANEDCLFNHSSCDTNNKACVCQTNHYVENGKCVPGVGSICQNPKDCAHLKNTKCTGSNSTERFCACEENHVKSDHLKLCLPIARYGESCEETVQCQIHSGLLSRCENGTCTCEQMSHFYLNECYRSKRVGQSCLKKPECFINGDFHSTICLNGRCSCAYDYALQDGICAKSNSERAKSTKTLAASSIIIILWKIS